MRRIYSLMTLPFFASASSFAAPTAYPQGPWNLAGVKNNTTSTLLADSKDNHLVWVMPPTSGTVAPTDFKSGNANLGFCREMADLQDYSSDLSGQIKKYSQRTLLSEQEVKAKHDAYYKAFEQAEAIKSSNTQLSQVTSLEGELDTLDKRIDELRLAQDKCSGEGLYACNTLKVQIDDLLRNRKSTRDELVRLRKSLRGELQHYSRAQAKAEALKAEWEDSLAVLNKIRGNLVESRKQLLDMYSRFAQLEGGFAQLEYETGWENNVVRLKKQNPDHRFEKIPTQDVRLNTGFVSSATGESYLAILPAILDYSFNGKSYLPYGPSETQNLGSLPEKMSASLRLSLVGACPLVHPELFLISKNKTGTPVFGTSATYNYPATFHTRVKFSYNLFKLFKQMQKSGSSGGFFHSSSWSEMSQSNIDRSTFEADWSESDPDNVTSEPQKREIESQVKAELMERVLKEMATPIYDGSSAPVSAPQVPQRGGMVLAIGLQSTCGSFSFFCSGGSWLFRGLDAIFGSSETESSFQKSHDSTATEVWSRDTIRLKPSSTVYTGI